MRLKTTHMGLLLGLVAVVMVSGAGSPSPEHHSVNNSDGSERFDAQVCGLVNDIAVHRLWKRLQGRALTLSVEGAAVDGAGAVVDGVLWVKQCRLEQVDGEQLHVDLVGEGWRWFEGREKADGGEADSGGYLKFALTMSMVGRCGLRYDSSVHLASIALLPTRPMAIEIEILNDREVETARIWTSLLGRGAAVVRRRGERRAMQVVRGRGTHALEAEVEAGLSLTFDLCTGQIYLKLGPSSPRSSTHPVPRRPFLVQAPAVLHDGGILFAGPFETDEPVVASIEVLAGRGVRATYVCEEHARSMGEAYLRGEAIPPVERPFAEQEIDGDTPVSLTVGADVGCRLVLVMRPLGSDGQATQLTYRVFRQDAKRQTWVDCE